MRSAEEEDNQPGFADPDAGIGTGAPDNKTRLGMRENVLKYFQKGHSNLIEVTTDSPTATWLLPCPLLRYASVFKKLPLHSSSRIHLTGIRTDIFTLFVEFLYTSTWRYRHQHSAWQLPGLASPPPYDPNQPYIEPIPWSLKAELAACLLAERLQSQFFHNYAMTLIFPRMTKTIMFAGDLVWENKVEKAMVKYVFNEGGQKTHLGKLITDIMAYRAHEPVDQMGRTADPVMIFGYYEELGARYDEKVADRLENPTAYARFPDSIEYYAETGEDFAASGEEPTWIKYEISDTGEEAETDELLRTVDPSSAWRADDDPVSPVALPTPDSSTNPPTPYSKVSTLESGSLGPRDGQKRGRISDGEQEAEMSAKRRGKQPVR